MGMTVERFGSGLFYNDLGVTGATATADRQADYGVPEAGFQVGGQGIVGGGRILVSSRLRRRDRAQLLHQPEQVLDVPGLDDFATDHAIHILG